MQSFSLLLLSLLALALSPNCGTAFVAPTFPASNAARRWGLDTRHPGPCLEVAGEGWRAARRRTSASVLGLRASEKDTSKTTSYGQSSTGVKAIVSGLTNLVNAVMQRGEDPSKLNRPERDGITEQELLEGIKGDYERRYLWTGDIDPYLYDYECVFTDPTLSFTGLETFQSNLANLRPFIDFLVQEDCAVEMYGCDLVPGEPRVKASWRMVGRLKVPWTPTIDLNGTTVFTYAPNKGNRIVDYQEVWETPPSEVLLQLLVPT